MRSRELIAGLAVALALGLLASAARAKEKNGLNMPMSFTLGTFRTPEFTTKGGKRYIILIRANNRFPVAEMKCMLGVSLGTFDDCDREPLLQADWTIWEGAQVHAQGSAHGRKGAVGQFGKKFTDRVLGEFVGIDKKKLVLELKFTKDGTALNVTDPQLVIEQPFGAPL